MKASPITGREERIIASLEGLHVLFVDDDLDTRGIVASHLGRYGTHMHAARNAREALGFLAVARPHVIVSDLAMPGMAGLEFIAHVRQLPGQGETRTPAIAYTTSNHLRAAALAAGFDSYVVKGADRRLLTDEVVRLAPRARL